VWQLIGQLAAQRAASLTEVTKLCLRWRDAAGEVALEQARELKLPRRVVHEAEQALQQTLDLTLIHVCDSFEAERRRADEELAFLATHDPLTGLPNRTLILDRLSQMLARFRRSGDPVAAVFIDLDNFKLVNDTLGHAAGDELLSAVALRLKTVLRETDALGRLGGDEFVVIAEDISLDVGPELIAQRLADSLGELELEMDLRDALSQGQFYLAYQPIFDLQSMKPTSVEALIRWRHPVRGVVQPEDFVPLLEEIGLICEIGSWVLSQACAQCSDWRAAGYEVGIAVNVSARQLDTDEFIGHVKAALDESGLDPVRSRWRSPRRRSCGTPIAPPIAWPLSRISVCAWRLTTSAPATPRSVTCSAFRSIR
jgi:diguanylate cyclase (GGDEF)-like protein